MSEAENREVLMKERKLTRNFAGSGGALLSTRKFIYRSSPRFRNAPIHYHPTPEFYLVLNGSCRLLMNNSLHLMKRGTLVWLAPKQLHVLCEQSFDCLFAIGSMTPAFLKKMELETFLSLESKFFELTESEIVFVEELLKVQPRKNDLFRQYTAGCGIGYILHALHKESNVHKSDLHPAIQKVVNQLHIEKEKTSNSALAKLAGMSVENLLRQFRQELGVSLTTYRNRQLVQRFLSIYGEGKIHNVTEAAFLAGFGSYAQFYRVFTKIAGYTPRAYQRLGKNDTALLTERI